MKAVVLHEYGGPDKLKYEDVPDPVANEGQVLVRMAATSVNPIDYKMRSGAAKDRFPLEFPAILGRDVAGIVREVGPGVTQFKPGDKVMGVGSKTYAELSVVDSKGSGAGSRQTGSGKSRGIAPGDVDRGTVDDAGRQNPVGADCACNRSVGRRRAISSVDSEEGWRKGDCRSQEIAS